MRRIMHIQHRCLGELNVRARAPSKFKLKLVLRMHIVKKILDEAVTNDHRKALENCKFMYRN